MHRLRPASPLCRATAGASARLEGVNKPELLPTGEFTPVIDVAGFLTDGDVRIRLWAGWSWLAWLACWRGTGPAAAVQPAPPPANHPCQQFTPASSCPGAAVALLQERRIRQRVEGLEADTGVKLRVLAQNYPQVGGRAGGWMGGWVLVAGRCLPDWL